MQSANTFQLRYFSWIVHYIQAELYTIFAAMAAEEGILGSSDWTDVWSNTQQLDVLDYLEDFEVKNFVGPRSISCDPSLFNCERKNEWKSKCTACYILRNNPNKQPNKTCFKWCFALFMDFKWLSCLKASTVVCRDGSRISRWGRGRGTNPRFGGGHYNCKL